MIFPYLPDFSRYHFFQKGVSGTGNVFMVGQRSGKQRDDIRIGLTVDIVMKKDQHSGRLTRGRVREILTASPTHPHGIKVRLEDGSVGRVAGIVDREKEGI
jgi:uncharacterized repeat protein (TIGR03833 family)